MSQFSLTYAGFGLICAIIGVGGAAQLGIVGVLVFVPLAILFSAAAIVGFVQLRRASAARRALDLPVASDEHRGSRRVDASPTHSRSPGDRRGGGAQW